MTIRLASFAVLVLTLSLGISSAEEKKGTKGESKTDTGKQYAKLDADSDGKVTAEEFAFLPNVMKDAKRSSNAQLAAVFAKLDKNKDKSISAEEFKKVTDFVKPKETTKKVEPKKK